MLLTILARLNLELATESSRCANVNPGPDADPIFICYRGGHGSIYGHASRTSLSLSLSLSHSLSLALSVCHLPVFFSTKPAAERVCCVLSSSKESSSRLLTWVEPRYAGYLSCFALSTRYSRSRLLSRLLSRLGWVGVGPVLRGLHCWARERKVPDLGQGQDACAQVERGHHTECLLQGRAAHLCLRSCTVQVVSCCSDRRCRAHHGGAISSLVVSWLW